MTTRKGSRRRSLFVMAGLLITACMVSVVVLSARKQHPNTNHPKTKHPKEWLTSTPQLGSKVKNLEIINPRIIRQDTDAQAVAFEIWNKSNRAVMAIRVSCGRGHISTDGLEDDEHPTVIIEPYGTLSAEMNDELTPGHPIVITAAVFDDGKEEGEKSSLDFLQRVRLRQRAVLKARKAQAAPGRSPKQ